MNIRILYLLPLLFYIQTSVWAQPFNLLSFDIELSSNKIGKLDPLLIKCNIANQDKETLYLSRPKVSLQIRSLFGKWEQVNQRRLLHHGSSVQSFIPKEIEANKEKHFDLFLPYLNQNVREFHDHHHDHDHDHDHKQGKGLTLNKNGTYYIRAILELQDGRILTSSEQRLKVSAYRGVDKEVAKILSELDHPFFLSDEQPGFYYKYRKQAQEIQRKYPNSKFGTLAGIFEAYWSVLRPYDKPYFSDSSADSLLTKHRRNTDGAIVKRAEMVLDLKKNMGKYRAQ